MNYYIAFITEDGFDWCVLESTDYDYIYRVFEDLSAPPGFNMELRVTEEDVDTHVTYEVLRYDHSGFPY